jgi:hypothetical protein
VSPELTLAATDPRSWVSTPLHGMIVACHVPLVPRRGDNIHAHHTRHEKKPLQLTEDRAVRGPEVGDALALRLGVGTRCGENARTA